MNGQDPPGIGGYLLAAAVGAIGGGFAVALATRAIPRMASRMMGEMMRHMASQADCDPAQM